MSNLISSFFNPTTSIQSYNFNLPSLSNLLPLNNIDPLAYTQALNQLGQTGVASTSSASAGLDQVSQSLGNQDQVLQQELRTLEPAMSQEWDSLNAARAKSGQAPLNYASLVDEMERIQNDPNISGKQKKKMLDGIRKRCGLSKKQMKHFFTKRFARVYGQAAARLSNVLNQANAQYADLKARFGENSFIARDFKAKLDALAPQLQSRISQYSAKGSFYNSCFKSGFFSKLGGFFKSVGSVMSKVLAPVAAIASFFPGIGTAISMGINVARTAFQAISGNWKGALSNLAFNLLSGAIPGGGVLGKIQETFQHCKDVVLKPLNTIRESIATWTAPITNSINSITSRISQFQSWIS